MKKIAYLVLFALFNPAACAGNCELVTLEEISSPDSKRDAILFSKNCGITAGYSIQVSIFSTGERPGDTGNVMIAAGDPRGNWGIEWRGNETLVIEVDKESELFRSEQEFKGVTVIYSKID